MNLTSTTAETQRPPLPTCPVCGGLECLCRPRFFAGQLLSEEDLRALDHYIIEKNRLHNRYLHGSGVVCGLQVICHECKGWVTIKSGYAIDPCGNDIIVCQDYSFDLCAKIQECCVRARKDWECEPMASPPPDFKDVEQPWYVTLRYREYESRGVTALKATSTPSYGSSSGACGCGCSPTPNGKRAAKPVTASTRPPVAQCEATRVCEGYAVEIAPAPRNERRTTAALSEGTFLGQVSQCVRSVKKVVNARNLGFLEFKQAIWEFLANHRLTRCELFDRVRDAQRRDQLLIVLQEYLTDCRCLALLPPCVQDPGDPRVILARVTVKGEDCHIVDICNLGGRRFVLTSPNVQYWASIIPLIEAALEEICCGRRR
jgi:hypothetical protein